MPKGIFPFSLTIRKAGLVWGRREGGGGRGEGEGEGEGGRGEGKGIKQLHYHHDINVYATCVTR
jgi:hypothetical protein